MLSIESTIALIIRTFKDIQYNDKKLDDKIALFLLNTLQSTYTDPTDTSKRRLLLRGDIPFAGVQAEIDPLVEQLSEINDQSENELSAND